MPHLVGGRSNHTRPTERGVRQSDLIGEYLRDIHYNPDAVYSSGAVRAHTTAMRALGRAGLPHRIKVEPDLLEMTHGEWEGKLRSEVYTPEAVAEYQLETLGGKLPGGESITDVQQRMWRFMQHTYEKYPGGEVLVFGHGLAIRSLAGFIRGQTKRDILATTTDNVSLTQITMVDRETAYVDFVGESVITE